MLFVPKIGTAIDIDAQIDTKKTRTTRKEKQVIFEPDRHRGSCDHCKSEVPLDAVVCASCGARWGSSTGKTRQQVYDEGKATLRTGTIVGTALLIFFLWTVYVESPWAILSMVLGFLGGPVCLGLMLGGFRSMRKAKTNLSIQWWRNA